MTSRLDYQGASPAAIQHHYDLSNEFYALWLDETRSYSCALWENNEESLQTAQKRKLDHLITAARATGARRVLDVGCGWGGMMKRLVRQHEVEQVVGLTLSDAQAEYVRGWADSQYDVLVQNWAEHQPAEPYDAIVSVGAFEHFADFGMKRADRVAAYRRFFTSCHDWLPRGGRLALQTNTKGSNVHMDRRTVRDLLFVVDKIFPESELPWNSEILQASERLFDVVSARNDPDHYARTCQCWRDALVARRDEASALVGADTVADYERYLAAAVDAFRKRHLGLVRIIFESV